MSPMAQTPGRSGDPQVGPDDDPTATILGETERRGERVGLHAGGPHQRLAREHLAVGERHVVGRHRRDLGAEPHLDAAASEGVEGVAAARTP